MYILDFTKRARKNIDDIIKSGNKALLAKVYKLLDELKAHPRTGTGKPKPLDHDLSGYWSRRISDKHRLVYYIEEEIVTVFVISVKDHYDDK